MSLLRCFLLLIPVCCLLHRLSDKLERKKILDSVDDIYTRRTVKENTNGLSVSVFDFQDNLPAGTTGYDRISHQSVFIGGGNGYGCYGLVGMVGLGCKDG